MGKKLYEHVPRGCLIYKLSFPDGSFYIGQTRNFRKRFTCYMSNARTNCGNTKLNKKIQEFGEPEITVLEELNDDVFLTKQDIEAKELEYILDQQPDLNRQYF